MPCTTVTLWTPGLCFLLDAKLPTLLDDPDVKPLHGLGQVGDDPDTEEFLSRQGPEVWWWLLDLPLLHPQTCPDPGLLPSVFPLCSPHPNKFKKLY